MKVRVYLIVVGKGIDEAVGLLFEERNLLIVTSC